MSVTDHIEAWADALYDSIVEDGRIHNPKRALKAIERALRLAREDGEKIGRTIVEVEVANAAGLFHGWAHLRGRALYDCIRQLAGGGRVRIVVEGEKKPTLRLVGGKPT